MNKPKLKRMVSMNVAISLGLTFIVLIALIGYFTVTGISAENSYNNLQNQNKQLQTWLTENVSQNENLQDQNSQLQTWLTGNITSLETQISSLNSTINVNVTNSPSPQLQYETVYLGNFNITSGESYSYNIPTDLNNPIFCGGYSKLSIMYQWTSVSNTSLGNFTLYLSRILWFSGRYVPNEVETQEYTHLSNSTFGGYLYYLPEPALVDVKAPYCSLTFTTETNSPNWVNMWVSINVWVYLRNE